MSEKTANEIYAAQKRRAGQEIDDLLARANAAFDDDFLAAAAARLDAAAKVCRDLITARDTANERAMSEHARRGQLSIATIDGRRAD